MEVDYDWVKRQFAAAKVRQGPGDAVLALLKLWETFEQLDPVHAENTVNIFRDMVLGHALVPETKERWVPGEAGFMLAVGDTVRVKADAFDGDLGRVHNGRVGRIVAKRYGDIIVRMSDHKQGQDDPHYPPNVLEKLVR